MITCCESFVCICVWGPAKVRRHMLGLHTGLCLRICGLSATLVRRALLWGPDFGKGLLPDSYRPVLWSPAHRRSARFCWRCASLAADLGCPTCADAAVVPPHLRLVGRPTSYASHCRGALVKAPRTLCPPSCWCTCDLGCECALAFRVVCVLPTRAVVERGLPRFAG